jgi:hypothetical protein
MHNTALFTCSPTAATFFPKTFYTIYMRLQERLLPLFLFATPKPPGHADLAEISHLAFSPFNLNIMAVLSHILMPRWAQHIFTS